MTKGLKNPRKNSSKQRQGMCFGIPDFPISSFLNYLCLHPWLSQTRIPGDSMLLSQLSFPRMVLWDGPRPRRQEHLLWPLLPPRIPFFFPIKTHPHTSLIKFMPLNSGRVQLSAPRRFYRKLSLTLRLLFFQ